MSKIIDAIERTLFGATAQERVDMIVEIATRKAEHRIVSAIDRAFGDAINDVWGESGDEKAEGNSHE